MRFFDTHLHMPTPDAAGFDALLRFVDRAGFVGGNLILNTPEEVGVAASCADQLPATIVLVPYFDPAAGHPEAVTGSGWVKLHPRIGAIEPGDVAALVEAVAEQEPRGVIVHAFPWGPDLRYNDTSLPLVIGLAAALPTMPVLVAHGGGYQAWAFRAHAGGFRNVHFDFSATLDYYEGSDVLLPLTRYLRHSPTRVHFGSDWPTGDPERQLRVLVRLAGDSGIGESDLEELLLENARACWPAAFGIHVSD